MKTAMSLATAWLCTVSGIASEPSNEPLASPSPTAVGKLVVGLAVDPPFVIKAPDGSWSGISVELWQEAAKELGYDYQFHETDLQGRFAGLTQGWLDASIGPLTITAQREQVCDFTHAYFVTGLGVAILRDSAVGNIGFGFDPAFLRFVWSVSKVALALLAVLAMVAVLIWFCERRANPAQFSGQGHPVRGLGASLWWAAVTMAAVGYGDMVPRTLLGRTIAVIWMFVSLVLVAAFTATMASTLTAERLASAVTIRGVEDLRQFKIGAVEQSSGAMFLQANHIAFTKFRFSDLLTALKAKKVQAIVYDEPILRYVIRNQAPGELTVLSLRLDTELYGFALREGSSLREPINRVLLQKVHAPAWTALVTKYLPGYQ
jgi:polar amino acid transport system substrate-binding protein